MNNNDRIFSILLLIAVIILLFAVNSLYMMKESEKDKRINLQKQFDGLTIEKQNIESKLKDAEIAYAQASSTVKVQEEKISALLKDLDEEKKTSGVNIAKIQEKESEIQRLKSKIEDVKAEKQSAILDLEKLNERHLSMKFQLENLLKTKEELENSAKELAEKEGVSLGTVVIKQSR